ncbi:MAG: glycosyl hydrolase [Candidatus Sumerlaeota bacterium]|nr:glycosyl hydrolase [Candidatus Sumerlaeota bacterium]
MRRQIILSALLGIFYAGGALAANELEKQFDNPPERTKPRCYWYWIDGQISREGITRDLEAMKRVGIGEGYIGIIGGGEVKALTEPWWQLVEHAVREGGRIGVDIGVFNCPGWSQSGGPWIKPGQSMRYISMTETRLTGPQRFEGKLPAPEGDFQDIAALAFPAPTGDSDTIARHAPRVTSNTKTEVTYEVAAPFTARSLTIIPSKKLNVTCELLASDDGQQYRTVKKFAIDRHNLGVSVGPIPLAPVTAGFPAVTARFFRLKFSAACDLAEIRLTAAARVESHMEKQLAKMFQDPQPPFDFYSWPTPAEPDKADLAVSPDAVRDITRQMGADGTLRWDAPAGEWIVLRVVAIPTGVKNSPAPPEATGLEVDKMSREALRAHFNAYIGKLLERIPEKDRSALKHVVADSYEMGPQNWTDDFIADFKQRYGYDPLRFLPALTGRMVGGADQSDRFLWDMRRMVADRVARDYVGGLRDLCRERGLKMWLENYGHWGFPGEFLKYGGSCDEISGEFWADGNLGSVELRDAASAAHIYGMPVVWAEAFTGGPAFRSTPASLKARGDWALCEGVNQFVLHVYIHQPWEDRRPGVNAWFGTEFNRHNTWFEFAKPWIVYHRRCSVMLQAGRPVADVAYFIGEDAPKMTGLRKPELPAGYDFDYINADVIENRLSMKDGRFVLPDGMSYKLLVLPESETMRPAVLKKLGELVAAGGAVFGVPPKRSPSLQGYPACDAEVRKLADSLWGAKKIMQGVSLQPALDQLQTPPDAICPDGILWKHRRDGDTDIYFLSNQKAFPRTDTISLRIQDRAPELWWPETGRIERPAVYATGPGAVRLPVHFGPSMSVFVVFRERATDDRIVEVTRNGQPVFDWALPQPAATADAVGTFTMAVWAKPGADTTLLKEANAGIRGMQEARNDAVAAKHGGTFAPGDAHAGSGIAIGRNGVAVFEHGAGYFAPVLVHAAPIADWTHVAVVYRDGEPSLFLNGVFARKGLKSTHIVHSSVTAEGGSPQFAGSLGGCESLPRALEAAEIAKLMSRSPKSAGDAAELPIELTREAGGKIAARAHIAGQYAWKTAAGATSAHEVASAPAPIAIAGPWEVTFDPKNGGPEKPVTFAQLEDWSKRSEEAIKYYSGAATYRKTFDLSDAPQSLWLDLGDVRAIARVRLNGRELSAAWKQPYRFDIAGAVRSEANTLEIEVVNTWLNRLLGDDQAGAVKRWTSATTKTWKGPLAPSGLLGPVTLQRAVEINLQK